MRNAQSIEEWLRDANSHIYVFEHQDGAWCIASSYSTSLLIQLHCLADSVPNRRDEILYAIAIKLQMSLGPDNADRLIVETERQDLIGFASRNWHDILRIDREMGLSGDFDSHVVPFMTELLGGDAPRKGSTDRTFNELESIQMPSSKEMSKLERIALVLFLIACSFGYFYSIVVGGALGVVVGFIVGVPCWIIAWIERSRSTRKETIEKKSTREQNRKRYAHVFDMPAPIPLDLEKAELVDLYDCSTCTYLCRVPKNVIVPLTAATFKMPTSCPNDIPLVWEILETPFMESPNELQAILEPHLSNLVHIVLRWVPVKE